MDPRDSSRLLVYIRDTGEIHHRTFRDLPEFLAPNDTLVINRTRVILARLIGRKAASGGKAELLLLNRLAAKRWEALVGGKSLHPGREIIIGEEISAEIIEDLGGARRVVAFSHPITPLLPSIGQTPLPPYIHEPVQDPEEYQTVFARDPGSAAAPTAGLHFTPELLDHLTASGISIQEITLHIGLDTFAPVLEDDPREHQIHSEWCSIAAQTFQAIQRAIDGGGRVVAVGTTTVRALETAALKAASNQVSDFEGPTDLFILPGHQFRFTGAMITNFHLPRSTLLMMVSAFMGREEILGVYETAIAHGYRFYSFGDAMLIL